MSVDGGALGAELQVVYTSLEASASQLGQAITVIDQVTGRADPLIGQAGAAGHADVTGAITSFIHTWTYGLSCLKSDATTLAQQLRTAADTYRKADQAMAAAAKP